MYGITRQAYYQHFRRAVGRARFEAFIISLVKAVRRRLPQSGGKNLWRIINRLLGIIRAPRIGRDHLARILCKNGLKVKWPPRRKPKTTYSRHSYAVSENVFKKVKATAPGQALVADITYIPLTKGNAYLFLITDAYSRMIVGHHLSQTLSADGAVKALKSALKHLPEPSGVIHHSDRGSQYCCHEFLENVRKWNIIPSMTDADHCAQNALAECMNGLLKKEFLLGYYPQPSFEAATAAVNDAINTYNHIRTHGELDSKTPAEVHYGMQSGFFEIWAKEVIAFASASFRHCEV